jgi:hypothetical protein
MAVFKDRGRTQRGEPFAVRFDAPEGRAVEGWLAAEGAALEEMRRLPLTAWPLARFGFMILLFPFLAYALVMSLALSAMVAVDMSREGAVRSFYLELAERGVATVGSVTAPWQESIRGSERRVFGYAFVDASGRQWTGRLAPAASDPAAGRHDLRLLADPVLEEDQELAMTVLADRPERHAPFLVDDALFERLDAQSRERRRQVAKLALTIPLFAWMIWNLLIRTGSHFELSPRDPRLVLMTRGGNPFVEPAMDD